MTPSQQGLRHASISIDVEAILLVSSRVGPMHPSQQARKQGVIAPSFDYVEGLPQRLALIAGPIAIHGGVHINFVVYSLPHSLPPPTVCISSDVSGQTHTCEASWRNLLASLLSVEAPSNYSRVAKICME